MCGLLHLVQRGEDWAAPQPAHAPSRCTKCNSPPINGQCTNFVLFDVALVACFLLYFFLFLFISLLCDSVGLYEL